MRKHLRQPLGAVKRMGGGEAPRREIIIATHDSKATGMEDSPLAELALRGFVGGALMGLANLLPGISGGTMLLVSGIYPAFVRAVAELTTLRFRLRALLLLACVAGAAALVILLFAGWIRILLSEGRWLMYSLFIGLTLGGAPVLWRHAKPASATFLLGAVFGLALLLPLLLFGPDAAAAGADPRGGDNSSGLLFVAGLLGAAAMILPGLSGATLLLLLGQYLPILAGLEELAQALARHDGARFADALHVLTPVVLGAALGLLALSNLLRALLRHFPRPTCGVLLGLLLSTLVVLWPFQHDALQVAGAHGGPLPEATAGRIAIALLLAATGFGLTRLIEHGSRALAAKSDASGGS